MKRSNIPAPETINAENKQLLKTIHRYSVQIGRQNRELEIESALEKVRVIAMRMKKQADMLEVCEAISLQLQSLGVKDIRNVQTAIFYPQKGVYMNYEYYAKHKKTFITETGYTTHKIEKGWALKMMKGKGQSYYTYLKGRKVKDWLNYQKTTNVFIDKYLEKASLLNYYWHSLGPVALGISTYDPLSKEDIYLFKRFLKVFELAYTRYLDIEQAHMQAQEAKIETSLEKVRSAAMAMHKAEDLLDICETMYREFSSLGFEGIRNAMINIHNDEDRTFVNYDYYEALGRSINHLRFDIHPVIEKQIRQMRSADDAFSATVFQGKDLQDWKKFRKKVGEKDDPRINKTKALYYYFYSIGSGSLGISTFTPIGEDRLMVLKRFRNVFNLAYQRFTEIKLAEEHAREAQIELGLERIRARAMAMHQTHELLETGELLYRELTSLGIKSLSVTYSIMASDEKSADYYGINPIDGKVGAKPFVFPHTETDVMRDILNAWKKKKPVHIIELSESATLKHQTYVGEKILEGIKRNKLDMPFSIEAFLAVSPKKAFIHTFNFKQGYLFIIGDSRLSDEQKQILLRFTKVFELTYRRFLDLKKAEAQTREAQVEAALERVRSRTMGMQKSEELRDVIQLVFEQFLLLNIHIGHTGFVMDYKVREDYDIWVADPNGSVLSRVIIPYFDSVYYNQFNEAKKNGENFFATLLSFEEKNNFYKELFQYIPGLPEEARDFYFNCKGLAASTVLLEDVGLYIENFDAIPYTDEENAILMRFGKVFQQTYTRFNDLKNAEAQARESKIQLALERVRASTMAMQRSEQLADTAVVMFDQFRELGVDPLQITIGMVNEPDRVIEFQITGWDGAGTRIEKLMKLSLDEPILISKLYAGWKNKEKIITVFVRGKELRDWIAYRNKFGGSKSPKPAKDETRYISAAMFSKGLISLSGVGAPSEETLRVLERFAAVFDLTYTRFLDLKNAEIQSREAQIELGLERVRARAMAMQNSKELRELIGTVFTELTKLDLRLTRCVIMIFDPKTNDSRWWMANSEAPSEPMDFLLPFHEYKPYLAYLDGWRNQMLKFQYVLEGKDKKDWDDHILVKTELANLPDFVIAGMRAPERIVLSASFNNFGCLNVASLEPLSDEHFDIMLRFAKVFDLTYTRFNDLKKAEAQARESQIEAALEKVRGRTMAMQHSSELEDAANLLFQQLKILGIEAWTCGYNIWNEDKKAVKAWLSQGRLQPPIHYPLTENQTLKHFYDAALRGDSLFVEEVGGEQLAELYSDLGKYHDQEGIKRNPDLIPPVFQVNHAAYFSYGYLLIVTFKPYPEAHDIFKRFAAVFEQTYTRFLDLQKAEAQAREARIETALEKVRSRTMAMQKSDELSDTVRILFGQLKELGEQPERAFIGVVNEPEHVIEIWATQHGGDLLKMGVKATIDEPYVMNPMYRAWKNQERSLVIDLKGESLEGYFQYLVSVKAPVSREIFGERRFENIAFFSKGMLGIITPDERSAESIQLYERFAGVFDLTYTRFLDLQYAEAQAREARIETSLERVRGKAMAMHNSKDLSETINVFFGELKILGITPLRCGLGAVDEKERTSTIYATTSLKQGHSYEVLGKLVLGGHPILENIFLHWKDQQDYFPVLKGKELTNYYQVMRPHVSLPDYKEDATQYGCYFYFKEGLVFAWSETEFSEEALRIFRRFTTVISLTYRRYIELQKAEANTREAVKQASLDRVRAEIASMRTINDLERITPLIWNELKTLGLPFIRCGVFIMDNEQSLMHTFLSTPDGKAIAAFHLPYDTPGNVSQILENWQSKKIYTDHWDEAAFREWTEILVKQGSVSSGNNYLASFPEGGFYLHFVPFLQGMLYVGNVAALEKEEIKLVKAVADAFSTAYARYEDFTRLEIAKKQVENTLADLKQAQQQLVQSEKMASLGELTAGIAHEIQNPLNFVNNFSEVSSELLEEMKTELETGNIDEAISIADDVRQNLEKINHHGKRADDIVKGMLQHSRSSSGQKEPTDINVLCEEYLRLSYHGLRAKDKTFNASFKTEFDSDLGKINVIPQDMGRVILNLINNAFYAVSEKKKLSIPGYEPTVKISTKKLPDKVEIRVVDNGMGIPQKIMDKIFQPFFTTKPTGQGTGLGLSLSYDIIKKGHGGDLLVDTKAGEGATFTIVLPYRWQD